MTTRCIFINHLSLEHSNAYAINWLVSVYPIAKVISTVYSAFFVFYSHSFQSSCHIFQCLTWFERIKRKVKLPCSLLIYFMFYVIKYSKIFQQWVTDQLNAFLSRSSAKYFISVAHLIVICGVTIADRSLIANRTRKKKFRWCLTPSKAIFTQEK